MADNMDVKARETACSIRKWAVSKGLMQALPEAVENNITGGVEPLKAGTEVEALIRQKGLVSIAYDAVSRTIFLYTKKKVYQKDYKVLPRQIGGCGIAYPQGVNDDIGKQPPQAQGAAFTTYSSHGADRYTCGSSISPGNSCSAGTLGALVRDATGKLLGLTNNHVSGQCNHASPGLPILAPGVMDVNPNNIHPFTIGLHQHVLKMGIGTQGNIDIRDNSDAATFVITNPGLVTSMQGGLYDTPLSIIEPREGMKVQKVGRTTSHTTGKIVGRELMPIGIHYVAHEYGFSGMIYFDDVWIVHGDNESFSAPGDSGSLIVTLDGDSAAVGLLFAGGSDSLADGGDKTLFLPIGPILEKLDVSLVGGHNV